MKHQKIIKELSRNKEVFKYLLKGIKKEKYLWKFEPAKWCLLEIICHLFDEECEDFRIRTKLVLQDPNLKLPSFDPTSCVKDRAYLDQNYNEKLHNFLNEREQSIDWLKSLKNPKWSNAYEHPKFGAMSASLFLSNWLAHDYLHIKQIMALKYKFLEEFSGEPLKYAGGW